MKKYLFLLLLGFLVFSSCEEEVNFNKKVENEAITGNWNLNAIRSYGCGDFDVELAELTASDTIYNVTIDSTYRDSFIVNPALPDDTTFFDPILVIQIDTFVLQGPAITEITKDSIPKLDPVSGDTIGYLYRYFLIENTGSRYSVNYVFDTIRQEDVVQNYVPCESLFRFGSDGNGSYSTKVFGLKTATGVFKWSDNSDGTFQICFDDDECKNYVASISAQGSMSLVDNSFDDDANDIYDCKGDYNFKKQIGYFGEYVWDEVQLTDCYASNPDSVVVFSDLECNVSRNNGVVDELGAVCYRLTIGCDNRGSFEVVGGPNEGVIVISVVDLGNDKFKVLFNNGDQNIIQFDGELDGEFFSIEFPDRRTLTGLTCNINIKLKKQ